MAFLSDEIVFRNNTANADILLQTLKNASHLFRPPLAQQIDLDKYADKLSIHSDTFEVWHHNSLIALVAIYLNDFEKKAGFITMVLCLQEFQQKGIVSRLLTDALNEARKRGFSKITLEVDIDNLAAQNLYKKFGFTETSRNQKIQMELLL